MSGRNVDRLRPLYDAWRMGAYDRGLEVLDPKIEWMAATEIPGHEGRLVGREAAARYLSDWRQMWRSYSVEVARFIERGDQVLVLALERGRGRESGVTVEAEFAQLWTMRDGRAVRMQEWRTWKEALEASGIRREG